MSDLLGFRAEEAASERDEAKTSLKVLLLAPDPHWKGGGVVNFIDTLSANLSAGVQVERHEIGRRPGDGKFLIRALRPLVDGLRLAKRLNANHYHITHINPSLNKFALLRDSLFMRVAQRRGKGHVVVFFHGWDPRMAAIISRHSVLRLMFRKSFGTAARIVVLASRFKAELIGMGIEENRIEVLTTMFDGSIFENAPPERRQSRKKILFLSRLIREKGIYELLEAFRQVHKRMPMAELLLAGDGEERSGIERWIRENKLERSIKLLGYVRGAEKGMVLADADVFVLPTRHGEGCPLAVLEAMAAGLPIITTSAGGIPDVVKTGKNGIVLDEVTPEAIERALLDALGNSDYWWLVGRTNMREAWQKYESKVVTAKLEAIYRAVQQEAVGKPSFRPNV